MGKPDMLNMESTQLASRESGGALVPAVRVGRLSNFRLVASEIRNIYREARQGNLPTSEACKLVYLLRELSQVMAVTVIESRLERLEGKGAGDGVDDQV